MIFADYVPVCKIIIKMFDFIKDFCGERNFPPYMSLEPIIEPESIFDIRMFDIVGQKADANQKQKAGNAPLHFAAKHGMVDLIKLLIANGLAKKLMSIRLWLTAILHFT